MILIIFVIILLSFFIYSSGEHFVGTKGVCLMLNKNDCDAEKECIYCNIGNRCLFRNQSCL